MEEDGRGLSHIRDKVFDAVEHVVTWGLEQSRWLLLKREENLRQHRELILNYFRAQ